MSANPKLLFFVAIDWFFLSHRLPIAREALRQGYHVSVVTQVETETGAEKIAQEGLKLIPIALQRSGMNPLQDLKTLRHLYHIYRSEKPDIVHQVGLKPVVYGTWIAWLTNVPLIVNAFAGLGEFIQARGIKGLILEKIVANALRCFRGSSKIKYILQNTDDLNLLSSKKLIRPSQGTLIKGSGVDTDRFRPQKAAEDSRPAVILASRMLWTKGPGDFVAAARILKANNPGIRMILVGAPDEKNPSAIPLTQLKQWDTEGAIEYWGQRDDMAAIMPACQVAVLPSTYGEGVPKFLIEAAAAGLPIVTYDVPGCREIVKHGVNGFLVPPKDIGSLTDALQRLLDNPELRAAMGKNGRKMVLEEFALPHVVRATIDLYRTSA